MERDGIIISNFSRGELIGNDAAEIFLREIETIRKTGSTNHPCAAHIHFNASKMIENGLSGQFYLNNSGYSLPSETIQLQISVNFNYSLHFTM